jgi:hypothetical protein
VPVREKGWLRTSTNKNDGKKSEILQSSVIIQNNGSIGVIVSVDLPRLASFTVADAARDGVDGAEDAPVFVFAIV